MTLSFSIKNRIGSENFDTIQTFFSRILSFGISLLFKILLARILTIEQNGLFGKWLASYNYAIIAFTLGLNLSLIYFRDNHKSSIINNFLGNILIYTILLVSCLIIGLFFTSKLYYYALFFSVFFGLLISSLNSTQLAQNNITIFNMTEISRNLFILFICIIPLFYYSSESIGFLYILYTIALLLTFLIFVNKLNISQFKFEEFILPNRKYLKYGLKGALLNFLGQSLYVIDIFIVSYMLGARMLGIYVVASSISRLLWFFVDAAGATIFPRLIEETEILSKQNSIYKLSTFSFLISIIGVIFFYFFGEFLISISFGSDYNEGFLTIIILMIASPGMIFYKLINRYLASNNDWSKSYLAICISVLINVLLNFILIKKFNIMGAAYASLVSYWLCGFLISRFAGFSLYKLMFSKDFIK
jgi:O-antigen/teichoic acid export membrane protein